MLTVLLAISLLSSNPPPDRLAAALRVNGDQASFMIKVMQDAAAGYKISIDCTERCRRAVHYRATTGDTPLGLFSRDQNDLVFSLWATGSAYRVVVWSVSGDGVKKIAELSSRARPDFMRGPDGRTIIQTYEQRTALLYRVRWSFENGHFVRSVSNSD